MIHPSIKTYLPQIEEILKANKVKSAFIFGSAVNDSFNENSDLDIIVNLQEGIDPVDAGEHLWKLLFALEDLTNRKVDILTERSLKNPFFIEEVNQSKIPIYG